jgi:DNA helicase II / ATP-dependent DNA helicase PcrA
LELSYMVEGQLPIEGTVELGVCNDEPDEARTVVVKLKELLSAGHPDVEGEITLSRCAVLGRNRFVFNALESELKSSDVPFYKKFSSAPYQSESDAFKQFELCLRLLANPRDRLRLEILVKAWGARPAESTTAQAEISNNDPMLFLRSLAKNAKHGHALAVMEAIEAMKWTSEKFHFLNGIAKLESFAATLSEEDRAFLLQDTAEWRKHWDYYVRSEPGGFHSAASFLGQVALGTTQQPKEDGLALLTVHASKGMEFDVIFLIGMNEGTFPDYRAKGPALEEEKRSAFVAVTRSKRLLYVTYPKARTMPWGAIKGQYPSRYLKDLFG